MLIFTGRKPSRALVAWIEAAHDDGSSPLTVFGRDRWIVVRRSDGGDLSPTEETEVRALVAANSAEPLLPPRQR